MSAPNLALKCTEHFDKLKQLIILDEQLDLFSFRVICNDCRKINDLFSITVLAMAHFLVGKTEEAQKLFEDNFYRMDSIFAHNYIILLANMHEYEKRRKAAFELADKYPSKVLTMIAANEAYALGKISLYEKFMDSHIKLLSEEEGRSDAMRHKEDMVNELDSFYRESGCTSQQFELVGTMMNVVLAKHKVAPVSCDVGASFGGSYVIDVKSKFNNKVLAMNNDLAEMVCDNPLMEGCNIVARFSPDRNAIQGAKYVYLG